MRIAVKEVGGELQILECDEKYRTECVNKFIERGHGVDFVKLSEDGLLSLGVDAEGLMRELPVNFLLAMYNPMYPIQKMVGRVVFTRIKYVNPCLEEIWDYEIEDLRDEDIETIKQVLGEEYQNRLKEQFTDYGKGGIFIKTINPFDL